MREMLHKILGQIGSELCFHETDSFHRIIVGENLVSTLDSPNWIGSSSFLQVIRKDIKAWMVFEIQQGRTMVCGGSYP